MIIKNQYCQVEVSLKAAEIMSFFDFETNSERMWQGNPEFWAGRNPVLFPAVGSSPSKTYRLNNQVYSMGNHGFVRNSTFTLYEQKEDEIVLLLQENEETLKQYPFKFNMYVSYKLIGKKLEISYRIENLNDIMMPFAFGLHPAFNCPVFENEKCEDYRIKFPSNEKQDSLSGDYILKNQIKLHYGIFEDIPSLIYQDLNSPYVLLTNGHHGVKVTCVGYKYLVLWTKGRNAPFICIEPWHSLAAGDDVDFVDRPGMIKLEAHRSYLTTYAIEIF